MLLIRKAREVTDILYVEELGRDKTENMWSHNHQCVITFMSLLLCL